MRITPATELTDRYLALQKLMLSQGLEAAILVQNSDLFYFTGSIQQGLYYLPVAGEPVYLVRKDFGRARMESGLKNVLPLKSLRDLPGQLTDLGIAVARTIGFELDVLPVQQYQRYRKLFAAAELSDVSAAVRTVRAIKSDYEIGIMKDCALIADKVFQHAKEIIIEGRTDLEVAAELEHYARIEGHQGTVRFRGFNAEISFGHVMSGADCAVPTFLDAPLGGLGPNPAVAQGASLKKIARNQPIIIDLLIAFDGYLVDQARTMSIGALPEQLQKAYYAMLKIQEQLFAIARPGISWHQLYSDCCKLAKELGYESNFMGAPGSQVSFIGHGIGIEVDEYPFIARGFENQLLEENMTFAFEPKAVFPGLGAVGVENSWRVAGDGIKRLTYTDESLLEL